MASCFNSNSTLLYRLGVATWLTPVALACASPPRTDSPQEIEAKTASWVELGRRTDDFCKSIHQDAEDECEATAQAGCKSIAEEYCAEMVVFTLDLILDDARDGLPLDSYQGLWDMEQKYRSQYGIVGIVGGEGAQAPIPQTPSEIAAARATAQADYESAQAWQQALWIALAAATANQPTRSSGFYGPTGNSGSMGPPEARGSMGRSTRTPTALESTRTRPVARLSGAQTMDRPHSELFGRTPTVLGSAPI